MSKEEVEAIVRDYIKSNLTVHIYEEGMTLPMKCRRHIRWSELTCNGFWSGPPSTYRVYCKRCGKTLPRRSEHERENLRASLPPVKPARLR